MRQADTHKYTIGGHEGIKSMGLTLKCNCFWSKQTTKEKKKRNIHV